MLPARRLIERYIIAATLPYFVLSLVLLTAVLVSQQGMRYADILGTARAPLNLAAEIALGLLPNILIFTLPMATLTGVATGFSRMGSDSELTAMRAAGVSTLRITLPTALLGLALSALTLYVGLEVAPQAARKLRQAAIKAALYRLESPVDPGTFYTELPGKVIYVRDGDEETGRWGRVFIYWQDANGPSRLITARSGRIDSSRNQSELALSDAIVTTLPALGDNEGANAQVTTEKSAQLRIRDDRLNTGRDELLKKLNAGVPEIDELDGGGLLARASGDGDAKSKREAATALNKRLALGVAPLIFSLLGASLGTRARRGGRGLGVLLSLGSMIGYYLLALAGEQLSKAGVLPPTVGVWLATGVCTVMCFWLLLTSERSLSLISYGKGSSTSATTNDSPGGEVWLKTTFPSLLDRSIFNSLSGNFAVAFTVLVSIFQIFTLFELLRYIASNKAGFGLVARYLFFLLPLASVALVPTGVLVAILVTYALMSRRSEAVAWWAAGQSIYRLTLPAFAFALCAGAGVWVMQENVLPQANRRQDALRAQIIKGSIVRSTSEEGRQWLATPDGRRIYTYEYGQDRLFAPAVFEFDAEGVHPVKVVVGDHAVWDGTDTLALKNSQVLELKQSGPVIMRASASEVFKEEENRESFKPSLKKAADMDVKQLSNYIKTLKRRGETAAVNVLSVSLERRRSDPFSPIVMVFVGVPLALAFGRRSALVALCAAVAIGLGFWGASSGFQQLGAYGILPGPVAAWSPIVIFLAAGVYLLFRART